MPSSIYDYLSFGTTLSFELYPSAIIGTRFLDVTVLGLLDKDTAKIWIDPDAMHVNVYPTLPNGSLDDPSAYQYAKLKHPNGAISVIGIPWIREDTITVSDRGVLTISIKDVTPEDMDRLRRAIAANGYVIDTITLE